MDIIHSTHALKGRRQYMEDNIVLKNQKLVSFTTILDGHGGSKCSDYMKINLFKKFLKLMKATKNPKVSLLNAILKADIDFMKKHSKDDSGSTCNALYVDKKNKKFVIANLGDSRALIYTTGNKIRAITHDHKPTLQKEKKYIIGKGGFVSDGRTMGVLAMSRALGDKSLKKVLNKTPDMFVGSTKRIKYFVQASDGLYDVMSNKMICNFINKSLKNNIDKTKIAKNLASYAINTRKSTDNTSVIISFLN